MDISYLAEDRFLRKNASQNDQTKDAAYSAINPVPKRGDDSWRKIGRPKGSEEDGGAPNILTGTVIVSCFIQTSALPSRIELQGNDLTFFDDTYEQNGIVIGDTSRLIFTHASGKKGEIISEGFVIEKRASEFSTYDNVLSWYAYPARVGSHNFMFIGRDGRGVSPKFNVHSITCAVNQDTSYDPGVDNAINGIFQIEYAEDTKFRGTPFVVGASKGILGSAFSGYSAFITAGLGGIAGIAYAGAGGGSGIYMKSISEVSLGLNLIPDADAAYDIGSVSLRIKDIYISGSIIGPGAGARAYAGFVNSTAGSPVLPSGWTAAKTGNTYTITHNLGTVNYGFSMTTNSHTLFPVYVTVAANSFDVEFRNSGGTAFATDFYFVLTPI